MGAGSSVTWLTWAWYHAAMSAPDGSLGFPAPTNIPQRDGQLVTDPDRPYMEFRIPAKAVSMGWASSGFGDGDLVFRMIELTPVAQDQAMKRGGRNQSKIATEMVLASVWQIGAWRTRQDRAKLDSWYAAIGPRGRKLVEAAWMSLHSMEDDDVATFLASGAGHAG